MIMIEWVSQKGEGEEENYSFFFIIKTSKKSSLNAFWNANYGESF